MFCIEVLAGGKNPCCLLAAHHQRVVAGDNRYYRRGGRTLSFCLYAVLDEEGVGARVFFGRGTTELVVGATSLNDC